MINRELLKIKCKGKERQVANKLNLPYSTFRRKLLYGNSFYEDEIDNLIGLFGRDIYEIK